MCTKWYVPERRIICVSIRFLANVTVTEKDNVVCWRPPVVAVNMEPWNTMTDETQSFLVQHVRFRAYFFHVNRH